MPWITTNPSKTSFYVKDWSSLSNGSRKAVHISTYSTRKEAEARVDALRSAKKSAGGSFDYTTGKLSFSFYLEKFRDFAAKTHKGYKTSEKYVFAALLHPVEKTLAEFKDENLDFYNSRDIQKWLKARIEEGADPGSLNLQIQKAKFLSKSFDSVNKNDILWWIKTRQDDGIAESTITRQLTLIKSTFEHCKKHGGCSWISVNPAKVERKDGDNPRTRRINKAERTRLLEAAKKHRKPYFALVIEFALETAARQGEIAKALIHNYNPEHKTLFLFDTKSKGDRRLSRTIGLTNRAVEIIEEALIKCPNKKGLIFGTTESAIKGSWQDYINEDSGFIDLHFHDCRHERISQMFEEGRMSAEQIMSFSGHRDSRSIQRYMHLEAIHTGKIMCGEKVLVDA